ncbi:MAG: hypothetical protein GY795_31430 [Desulfobacterales bacterium]|nr:hypothetical protein [Desulfobacterales bacterium]
MKKIMVFIVALVCINNTIFADTHTIDSILARHWHHTLNHRDIHLPDRTLQHPALIETHPDDPTMMIPYAFADSEDIDQDGLAGIDPDKTDGKDYELLVVSESASYALLRAVWMKDQAVFNKVWKWINKNIQRINLTNIYDWKTRQWVSPESLGLERDHLFAWRWVPTVNGKNGIIAGEENSEGKWIDGWGFASDADEDIALALIFADCLWGSSNGNDIFNYELQAQMILDDLWNKGTVVANGKRYLNGGTGAGTSIEPGYLSPYSYRIFEEFDPYHSWKDLTDSSYDVFEKAAVAYLSGNNGGSGINSRLLPDWIMIDKDGTYTNSSMRDEPEMGYDAFRAYWRIALDYRWYDEPRAYEILKPDSSVSPHNFIESVISDEWSSGEGDPTEYNETGKIPRIFKHNGSYLLNDHTGAGAEEASSGNRADIASYAVWLAYFSATGDNDTVEILIDPITRTDKDDEPYQFGSDGWLNSDSDGFYWTIQDHSDWKTAEVEYYSNAWGWFGLAQYHGLTSNLFDEPNQEPVSVSSINLYTESSPLDPATMIKDSVCLTVEVVGKDADPGKRNFTYARIHSSDNDTVKDCGEITVKCVETGNNTGKYRGVVKISAFSDDVKDEIGATVGTYLTFSSEKDMSVKLENIKIEEISFGNNTLVDSCEHESDKEENAFGGYWYYADDNEAPNNNESDTEMSFVNDGANHTEKSVRLGYTLKKGDGQDINKMFAILGTSLVSAEGSEDIDFTDKNWVALSFYVKGDGHEMTVILNSGNITDWDDYSYKIETTLEEWRRYIVRFKDFHQEGFGIPVGRAEALEKIKAVQFKASSKTDGETGWFQVDEIVILGNVNEYDLDLLERNSYSLENYASEWGTSGDLNVSDTTEAAEGNGATLISAAESPSSYWVGMLCSESWQSLPHDSRNWTDWDGISLQLMVPENATASYDTARIRLEVRENISRKSGNGQTKWYPVLVNSKGFRIHIPKEEFYLNGDKPEEGGWNGDWANIEDFIIHYGSANEKTKPKEVIIDDIRLYRRTDAIPGDIDNSGTSDLSDIILAIKIVSGIVLEQDVHTKADVNGDGKIGMEEALHILQKISGCP